MMDRRKELVAVFVERVFKAAGAVLEDGHFVYASKRHGNIYLDHHAIYTNLRMVFEMCWFMADEIINTLKEKVEEIDVILGPEGGGIILATFLKTNLEILGGSRRKRGNELISLWAKKVDKSDSSVRFVLPRAFQKYIAGKNVFLIDDVLTFGSTFRELAFLCENGGGKIVSYGCLWNRGGVVSGDLGGLPVFSLLEKKLEDWPPEECPLCRNNISVNKNFGHPEKI